MAELENIDVEAENPKGVPIDGFLYGGRDSDTTLPVVESLSWEHGVFLGATLESETTAATLGKQGVRRHDPMANLDFISVPFAIYLENHLSFQKGLTRAPKIFATNYFLKNEQGLFLNDKMDKKVWIIWAEGRVHDEWESVETPVGKIPFYEDLKYLFKRELHKDYSQEEYVAQFSLRVDKYLAKMDRMKAVFAATNIPVLLVRELEQQIERLNETKEKFDQIILSPYQFYR